MADSASSSWAADSSAAASDSSCSGSSIAPALAERGQQRAVVAKVRLGLKARLFCLTQIVLQLTQALLPMLDALLDARDVAAD